MSAAVQAGATAVSPASESSVSNNATSSTNTASVSGAETTGAAGWMYKWTNYLKGYRKRWFVLQNSELSYYRSQAAVARGGVSRGTISLRESEVRVAPYERDPLVILLHVSGASRVYLKAPNEAERLRWFTALRNAVETKTRAAEPARASGRKPEAGPEPEDETLVSQSNDVELNEAMGSPQRDLDAKVAELQFCVQMLAKQQSALGRELTTLSGSLTGVSPCEPSDEQLATAAMRALNERGSLMRVTATTALRACDELSSLAAQYGTRYRRLIEHERAQRHSLETLIEQLARQHRSFEKQARKTLQRAVAAQNTRLGDAQAKDTRPAPKKGGRSWLKRSSNNSTTDSQSKNRISDGARPLPVVHSPIRQNTMPILLMHSHSSQQLLPAEESKRPIGSATHSLFINNVNLDEDEDGDEPSALFTIEPPVSNPLNANDAKLLKTDTAASTANALSKSEQNLSAACSANAVQGSAPSRATSASAHDRDLVDFGQPTQFDDDSDDDEDEDDDDDFFDALDTSPAGSPALTKSGTAMSSMLIEAHQRFQSQNALARSRVDSVRDSGSAPSTPSKAAHAHATSSLALHAGSSNSLLQLVVPAESVSRPPVTAPAEQPARARAGTAPTNRPGRRVRRSTIAYKPTCSVNLWSILKNCVGKELSRIPMPVNFSEPISLLQRFSEDFEYSACLDHAAQCSDPYEAMAHFAAFTVSRYSSTINRITKPFNPLLAETYEMDRSDEPYGWRLIAEQVSHHPPIAALNCESPKWNCSVELTMTTKFRGKYIQIQPFGVSRCDMRAPDGSVHQYSWTRVTTTVHNIIVGRLWIDQHGEMEVRNHTLGIRCQLKYLPYSYFSRDVPHKVTGAVYDAQGNVRFVLEGTWDEQVCGCAVFPNPTDSAPDASTQVPSRRVSDSHKPSNNNQTRFGERRVLWRRNPPLRDAERMYNFTQFAIELNEFEPDVAPTDSRRRPDQRLMENGEWDAANREKMRLEEKQRVARKRRELTAQLQGSSGDAQTLRRTSVDEPIVSGDADTDVADGPTRSNAAYQPPRDLSYKPRWFDLTYDSCTGSQFFVSNGRYWTAKAAQDWSGCPDIF